MAQISVYHNMPQRMLKEYPRNAWKISVEYRKYTPKVSNELNPPMFSKKSTLIPDAKLSELPKNTPKNIS